MAYIHIYIHLINTYLSSSSITLSVFVNLIQEFFFLLLKPKKNQFTINLTVRISVLGGDDPNTIHNLGFIKEIYFLHQQHTPVERRSWKQKTELTFFNERQDHPFVFQDLMKPQLLFPEKGH